MPSSGDVVVLDFGLPQGHEAGFPRPAVVVTADKILKHRPSVVQVVPLTSTIRNFDSEVLIEPDAVNGLTTRSAAQCQHIRSVATSRLGEPIGRLASAHTRQIREVLGLLLDL